MTRLIRILKDAGLWFLVVVVLFTIVGPPLSRRGVLLFAAAGLVLGMLKELIVVRTGAKPES